MRDEMHCLEKRFKKKNIFPSPTDTDMIHATLFYQLELANANIIHRIKVWQEQSDCLEVVCISLCHEWDK